MSPSPRTDVLEQRRQLWQARAQTKQKWLEQTLAAPSKGPHHEARRNHWIKRALNMVKRGQAEVKYHAALMDAYAEHLSVLEMTLISATEQKSPADAATSDKRA